MKIGVLTSSRADFGIYTPLLEQLEQENIVDVEIIAFGTHLSPYHGDTIQEITKRFELTIHKIYGMPLADSPQAIAGAYGSLVSNFAQFWANNKFDYVLALGDRYEMSAAVQATIPYGIKVGHIHGGETTLGAIDNIYRHQITLASSIHFASTAAYAARIADITGDSKGVHWVGAMSISGLASEPLPSWEEVGAQFDIPVGQPFVLATVHPETVKPERNPALCKAMVQAFGQIAREMNIVVTLPNVDTYGSLFRNGFSALKEAQPNAVFLIENFGRKNYFATMKASKFLMGNSSSAIIEAASVGKHVINIGGRQRGRAQSDNVINVPFETELILEAFESLKTKEDYDGQNVYFKANTPKEIIRLLFDD